jgi:hypothetical protein
MDGLERVSNIIENNNLTLIIYNYMPYGIKIYTFIKNVSIKIPVTFLVTFFLKKTRFLRFSIKTEIFKNFFLVFFFQNIFLTFFCFFIFSLFFPLFSPFFLFFFYNLSIIFLYTFYFLFNNLQ